MKYCSICSSEIAITKKIEGYQEGSIYEIAYCNSCNTSMALPAVIDENIYNIIYKNIAKVDGYERYYRISKEIKGEKSPLLYLAKQDAMYWAVNKFVSAYPNIGTANILEVGCGFGYLTYALSNAGLNIKGIDISSEAVKNAKENYGNFYEQADVFEFSKTNQEKYDIIVLTEVIEHITEIVPFIESLLMMLKRGGKLLITTPNKSVFKNENIWDTELPPIHFWWFSENSFLKISRKLNVSCEFLDFTDFNKNFTDFTQSVFYKSFNRNPVISKQGDFINANANLKSAFKSTLKKEILKLNLLNRAIFKKKGYDHKKSNTLCVILTK